MHGSSVLALNPELSGPLGFNSVPVAFNSQDEEFLVVWNQLLGSNQVFARRVAVDGSLPGETVPITAGPDTFIDPSVAYNPGSHHYFVTWRFQGGPPGSPDFNNAFGRLVAASGEPVGEVVHVSNAGLEPTLAFNPVTGELFHHARNFAGGGAPGISFRRIDGDGVPIGSPTVITSTGGPGEAGVNTVTGEYLSTWRSSLDEDTNLNGQRLDGEGLPLGDPFVISDVFPAAGIVASVAYDPDADVYLVVFGSFFESPPPLYARFVSGAGEPVGPQMTLVEGGAFQPAIAFDPINEVYLLTWFEQGSGLWAQPLTREAAALGRALNVYSGTTLSFSRGWLAVNENDGGFLVSGIRGEERVVARLVDVIGGCTVLLDPPGIAFGDQEVGSTSEPQSVTLENDGSVDLEIGTLALGGDDSADFSLVNDACSGQTVAPGASCAFEVSFSPSETEGRAGQVEIPSNALTSPDTVALNGTGVAPLVVLLPPSLSFGEVDVGETAPARRVELFNNGTADLVVGDLAVSGDHADDYALIDDGCSGVTLGVRTICSFDVTFTPTAAGTRTAQVDIPSNASSSPDAVPLQGIGVAAEPDISLSAAGRRVQGLHKVDLSWSGATSAEIDVLRDGEPITTVPNDGHHTDDIDRRGRATYVYKVCEAGTAACSNEATVSFGGPAN